MSYGYFSLKEFESAISYQRFLNDVNAFFDAEHNKCGIVPLFRLLNLSYESCVVDQYGDGYLSYEDDLNDLFSDIDGINEMLIDFLNSYKDDLNKVGFYLEGNLISEELIQVCDQAIYRINCAQNTAIDLENLICNTSKLIPTENICPYNSLERIIESPNSSSLKEITRLLYEIDPKKFSLILDYIIKKDFSQSSKMYSFTINDNSVNEFVISHFEKSRDYFKSLQETSTTLNECVNYSILADSCIEVLCSIEKELNLRNNQSRLSTDELLIYYDFVEFRTSPRDKMFRELCLEKLCFRSTPKEFKTRNGKIS